MMEDKEFRTSILESKEAYRGSFFGIKEDSILLPKKDTDNDPLLRQYVVHPGAVAVLATRYDEENNQQVLMFQQYRHAVGKYLWEIPAGLLDKPGEDKLEAAKRELAEEVDAKAKNWIRLVDFHPSPGISSEVVTLFWASDIIPTTTSYNRTEEEKDIKAKWIDLNQALEAVLEGRIAGSITMISLLFYYEKYCKGKEKQ